MRAPAHNITLQRGQRRALRAVAMFELTKGIFVLVMGICALLLVHRDLWLMAESLLALLHVNTDRRFAQLFLDFADNITDARLGRGAYCVCVCRPPLRRILRTLARSQLGGMAGVNFRNAAAAL